MSTETVLDFNNIQPKPEIALMSINSVNMDQYVERYQLEQEEIRYEELAQARNKGQYTKRQDLVPQPGKTKVRPKDQLLEEHTRLIGNQTRQASKDLIRLAAVSVQPGVSSVNFDSDAYLSTGAGIAEVGCPESFTHTVLFRRFQASQNSTMWKISLVYAGFKSRIINENGYMQAVIDYDQNCFAYDLRNEPRANVKGATLSARKRTTIQHGLDLESSIQRAYRLIRLESGAATEEAPGELDQLLNEGAKLAPQMPIPKYWAAFDKDECLPVEVTPAAKRAVIKYLSSKNPESLPCMESPGGELTAICHDVDGQIALGFGGEDGGLSPETVVMIPHCSVLAPYVKVGMTIEKGASLGSMVPQQVYSGWNALVARVGEEVALKLMNEVVSLQDTEIEGMQCRRLEFCPAYASERSVRVYEDVRHLLEAGLAKPRTISYNNPNRLCSQVDDVIFVNLSKISNEWERNF